MNARSGDVGSDFWVGVDLVKRCHTKFAASVFTWLAVPGFILGWGDFFVIRNYNAGAFFKALFFPILVIPYTLWKLIKAALNIDDVNNLEQAKL